MKNFLDESSISFDKGFSQLCNNESPGDAQTES